MQQWLRVAKPRDRVREFLRRVSGVGVDLAVVTTSINIRYLTGVKIETYERVGALIACPRVNDVTLVVPKLDEGKAKLTGLPYLTYLDSEGPINAVKRAISMCGTVKVIGFEANTPLRYLWLLRGILGEFVDSPIDNVLRDMRMIKDDEELSNIKMAVKAIEEGLRAAEESLKPGITEAWLARVISDAISDSGAEPRDILVQSGPNSAIPHWLPSNRRIEDGDVVVIDVSATYNDYYGDLTRTFKLGEAAGEFLRIYELVKEAHDEAIKAVKEGVTGSYVDSVARGVINNGGYGEYFIHRTGHGIGLEVHEEPYVSGDYNKPLLRGSVFTIEPGIYIPGRFGVRLESDVALSSDGVIILDSYWPSGPLH